MQAMGDTAVAVGLTLTSVRKPKMPDRSPVTRFDSRSLFDLAPQMRQKSVPTKHCRHKRLRWCLAIEQLAAIRNRRLELDGLVTYNNVINSCQMSSRWNVALETLGSMQLIRCTPDLITCNSVIASNKRTWKYAVQLMHGVHQRKLHPDVRTYGALMGSLSMNGQWHLAMSILNKMCSHGPQPNIIIFNAAINSCVKDGHGDLAVELLRRMPRLGVLPDVVSYTSTIGALATAGNWEMAVSLLLEMGSMGVLPNEMTFLAAIRACSEGQQWEWALNLFEQMKNKGLAPNLYIYSAVIKACAKAEQWEWVIALWQDLQAQRVKPDILLYKTVISACRQGGLWQWVTHLVCRMQQEGLEPKRDLCRYGLEACSHDGSWELAIHLMGNIAQPDLVDHSHCMQAMEVAGHESKASELYHHALEQHGLNPWRSPKVLDLHELTTVMAKIAVRNALSQMSHQPSTLNFVTGIGKHSKGGIAILKPEIISMLRDEFGLEVEDTSIGNLCIRGREIAKLSKSPSLRK